jgi:hypothetical protein
MMKALTVDTGREIAQITGIRRSQFAISFQTFSFSVSSSNFGLASPFVEQRHVTAMQQLGHQLASLETIESEWLNLLAKGCLEFSFFLGSAAIALCHDLARTINQLHELRDMVRELTKQRS